VLAELGHCVRHAAATGDELLHYLCFDNLLAKGAVGQLMALRAPYLEAFVGRECPVRRWQHLHAMRKYSAAVTELLRLAGVQNDATLGKRVSPLQKAVAPSASSSRTHLRARLRVAEVQDELLERAREFMCFMDSVLCDMSDLFTQCAGLGFWTSSANCSRSPRSSR